MEISYKKLWKLLIDKGLKKTDLKRIANISSCSLAKLGKNENVSLEVLKKICLALHCDIGDIVETVRNDETSETELDSQ
jgi:DNA-binding Xre family transcriptional regulator